MLAMEKSVFRERMAALSPEEQEIAAEHLPDEIMFAELQKRSSRMRAMLGIMEQTMSHKS